MATQWTTQSADVTQRATLSARLRRSLIIAALLMVMIIGAVGYGLFARWASMQGGPEMAPGSCGSCHQGPVLGSVTLDFTEPTA
jgi:hypothetical protein